MAKIRFRELRPGEDFLGDKIAAQPVILKPHKHAALALRLHEESKRKRAASLSLVTERKHLRK